MRKVLLSISVSILSMLFFTGCRMNNKTDSIVDAPTTIEGYAIEVPDAIEEIMEVDNEPVYGNIAEGMVNCEDCGVELLVEESSYSIGSEQIEYSIINRRTEPVSLVEEFLEYFDGGRWKRIPMEEVARLDILNIVPEGQTRTFTFLLFPAKHTYLPGRYRIVQQFCNEVNGENYSLAGEFRLN